MLRDKVFAKWIVGGILTDKTTLSFTQCGKIWIWMCDNNVIGKFEDRSVI